MSFFFKGQLLTTPAVVSTVNDAAMLPRAVDVGNAVAYIGKAAGGKPNTILEFDNPDQAVAALGKGDLVDAIVRGFNPSSDTGGPAKVIAIRVDPALQSALALRDSVAATVINLASTGFGLRENQVKVKVEEASGGRGLKLTTQRGNDFFSRDNVYRDAFQIRYTGGQASAVMSVSQTQVILSAPSGTPVATIDLATFPTIQELVDRINATTGFTASVLDGNGAQKALDGLDTVSAQDVRTANYTARADLQAVVDWFNSASEGYVTATRASGVGTLPVAMPFTHMTGGSDGSTTNSEWTAAFTTLQTADVQWFTPLSSDPSIHAMAAAHEAFMSTVGNKERRAIVGAPLGTSDAAAIALAKAINSDRTSLVHLGGYDYDVIGDGALKLFPPMIVAAMIAGAFAGVAPGTPLTGKSLRLRGLERKLRVPVDTDALLSGGVLPIEDSTRGYRVVQSISTWLTNGKFNRREQSVGAALDFSCRFIRDRLESLKGAKGNPQTLSLAYTTVETACLELAKLESSGGPGVLAGDEANPPFKNLTVTLTGDAITVAVELSPVIPVNYVAATINAVPYSGTATIA